MTVRLAMQTVHATLELSWTCKSYGQGYSNYASGSVMCSICAVMLSVTS